MNAQKLMRANISASQVCTLTILICLVIEPV